MKLVEGTHYTRRADQPYPHPIRAKEMADCMFCRLPSDSEDEGGLGGRARMIIKLTKFRSVY